jgi:NADH-quinone oxidoreductase subunit C
MATPANPTPESEITAAPVPEHFAVARLREWQPSAILSIKTALGETTITVAREKLREACSVLKAAGYNFLSDVTCLDMLPAEPRFHVIYHLLSHGRKERVRLKVPVNSTDAAVDSVIPVWPAANFYEREIFDLFGVRFGEHPNMRRIMMPEDWEGHPLRKDYPVEGYR